MLDNRQKLSKIKLLKGVEYERIDFHNGKISTLVKSCLSSSIS